MRDGIHFPHFGYHCNDPPPLYPQALGWSLRRRSDLTENKLLHRLQRHCSLTLIAAYYKLHFTLHTSNVLGLHGEPQNFNRMHIFPIKTTGQK